MEQFFIDCQTVMNYLAQSPIEIATLEKAIKKLIDNYKKLTQQHLTQQQMENVDGHMKDATTKIAAFVIQAADAAPVYTHVSSHDRPQFDKAIKVVKDYLQQLNNANAQTILNAARSGLILCRICCRNSQTISTRLLRACPIE